MVAAMWNLDRGQNIEIQIMARIGPNDSTQNPKNIRSVELIWNLSSVQGTIGSLYNYITVNNKCQGSAHPKYSSAM